MCDTIVHMSGPALTTFSFLLWTIVFGLVAGALWSRKYERYLEVANWIVSSMHAIVTTGVGILIVKNTRHDLIYAKCALTGTTTFPEKRKKKAVDRIKSSPRLSKTFIIQKFFLLHLFFQKFMHSHWPDILDTIPSCFSIFSG